MHKFNFAPLLLTLAASGLTGQALAVGAGQILVGNRAADFEAAPGTKTLQLSEVKASFHSEPLWHLPVVTAGFGFSYNQMRGSPGSGLTSFEGYNYGPEVTVQHTVAGITPFGTLSYRLGRYTGKGQENWSGAAAPALFLYHVTPDRELQKTYVTTGTHIAAGASWQANAQWSVVGEIDLGFDRMESDARVVDGDRAYDRERTTFDSRSLLIGSQMSI